MKVQHLFMNLAVKCYESIIILKTVYKYLLNEIMET